MIEKCNSQRHLIHSHVTRLSISEKVDYELTKEMYWLTQTTCFLLEKVTICTNKHTFTITNDDDK